MLGILLAVVTPSVITTECGGTIYRPRLQSVADTVELVRIVDGFGHVVGRDNR